MKTGTVTMHTSDGAHNVAVEIARTDGERRRGLMRRNTLAPDAGMLFVFDRSAQRRFWMKDTYVPLDLIFIDSDGRVVGVEANTQPLSLELRGPTNDAQYILEVPAGWAFTHGVDNESTVTFEKDEESGVNRYIEGAYAIAGDDSSTAAAVVEAQHRAQQAKAGGDSGRSTSWPMIAGIALTVVALAVFGPKLLKGD